MTPAVNDSTSENGTFHRQWYYGGGYINTTSVVIGTLKSSRVRPASVPGDKVDGLWPLKAWHHKWTNYRPIYKTCAVSPKREPLSLYVYSEGIPWFAPGQLEEGVTQVAPFVNGGLFPVGLDAQTRAEFFERLSSSKWELGETLAEAKEVSGFLRTAAESLSDLLRKLGTKGRRKTRDIAKMLNDPAFLQYSQYVSGQLRPSGSRQMSKKRLEGLVTTLDNSYGMKQVGQAADQWLGWQFGAKPLLQDLANATVHLNSRLFTTPENDKGRIRLSVTKGSDFSATSSHNVNGTVFQGSGYIEWDVRSVMTIVGDYVLDNRQLRANQQLGLTNPVALGYAVIPYSWLVDYFVDIGSWLNELTAPLGLRPLGCSISRTQWVTPKKYEPASNTMTLTGLAPYLSKTTDPYAMRMVRSLEPQVWPGLPPLGEMLNVTQATNALAVLTKLMR